MYETGLPEKHAAYYVHACAFLSNQLKSENFINWNHQSANTRSRDNFNYKSLERLPSKKRNTQSNRSEDNLYNLVIECTF